MLLRYSILFVLVGSVAQGSAQVPNVEDAKNHNESQVSYNSGDANLSATLLIPKGNGPFPALVVIHGSGPSTRSNAWTSAYVNAFIKRGVAVLYPDKRGSGKSTGDWTTATMLDLAGDAIAGVELLHKTVGIDKDRIGVIGFSQGGHIAPAAASRSKNIAFAISVSASVVPISDQIIDEVEMSAERAGLTKEQIETVNEINRKGLASARTGRGEQDYLDSLAAAKNGPLKGNPVVERFPTDPNHPAKRFVKAVGDYDPMPYWRRMSIPSLFVFGGKDTQIRIKKSIDRINESLGAADKNYTVLLFGKNGHGIFREDLLDLMARWISTKGID